jgi:hypothetical protein
MRIRYVIPVVVLAIILTTSAYATTISVPSWNHPDWSTAKMSTGGTCYRGSAYQYWPASDGASTLAINSPFGDHPYGQTCGGSTSLGTVCYGTDIFKGKALADIVRLEYSVYMYDVAHLPWSGSMGTTLYTQYGDGKAWGLEIIADKGNGSARPCVYIPPAVSYNTWVSINALTQGNWINANPSPGTLYDWAGLKGSMNTNCSMWNSGITASTSARSYPGAAISVTGKQFNFIIGNRTTGIGGDTSYWQKTFNSAGMIGSLTVQFAGESEATTYNFVPEPSAIVPLMTGLVGFVLLRRRTR